MSKRPSRLTSSVQNPLACWREKSATFTVLSNQGERHPAHFSLNQLEARMAVSLTVKNQSVK